MLFASHLRHTTEIHDLDERIREVHEILARRDDSVVSALAKISAAGDRAVRKHNAEAIVNLAGPDRDGGAWVERLTHESIVAALTTPRTDLIARVDEARSLIAENIPTPTRTRRRVARGRESGDAIDADRFIARVPECWDRSERQQFPARTVRLVVNLATAWDTRATEIIWRGAVAVALADELALRGFAVEIVAASATLAKTHCTSKTETRWISATVVKQAGEPIDLARVSMICCSLGFYRFGFLAADIASTNAKVRRNLGIPTNMARADLNADIVIDHTIRNQSDAVREVERFLADIAQEAA